MIQCPQNEMQITAELERLIHIGALEHVDKEETIDHIPATLKDVCEWWIKTYPEDVFHTAPVQVVEIRNNMKVILDNLK